MIIMSDNSNKGNPWGDAEQDYLVDSLAEFIIKQAAIHKRTEAAMQTRVRNLLDTYKITSCIKRTKEAEDVLTVSCVESGTLEPGMVIVGCGLDGWEIKKCWLDGEMKMTDADEIKRLVDLYGNECNKPFNFSSQIELYKKRDDLFKAIDRLWNKYNETLPDGDEGLGFSPK